MCSSSTLLHYIYTEIIRHNPEKDSREQLKGREIDQTKKMAVIKLEIAAAAAATILLLSFSSISDARVFDVTKYGAKADGKTCIDQVITQATLPTFLLVAISSICFMQNCI